MTSRRLKLALVVAGAALGALVLLAWTQPWFAIVLDGEQSLSVTGQDAAPALSALGVAALALAGALAIAGHGVRMTLGVVELLLGAAVTAISAAALGDPVAASASTVTEATALAGADSVAALVQSATASAWPWLAIVFGVLLVLVGGAVVITSRRWPGPTRAYDSGSAETGTAGAWDALSEGDDPTVAPRAADPSR